MAQLQEEREKKLAEEKENEEDPAKLSKNEKVKIEVLLSQAEELVKTGKEDEAIKLFVQALAVDQAHIETQQKLALLYLQKQMFSAAAALFKQLADSTADPVHYSHLGFALYQQNAFDEAKEAYQKAVDLDSSRPQRFVSLAQVYRALNQLQNAVIALNKAIELDKENLEFLLLLTQLHVDLDNLEDAQGILNKALELDPENEEARSFLKKLKRETK